LSHLLGRLGGVDAFGGALIEFVPGIRGFGARNLAGGVALEIAPRRTGKALAQVAYRIAILRERLAQPRRRVGSEQGGDVVADSQFQRAAVRFQHRERPRPAPRQHLQYFNIVPLLARHSRPLINRVGRYVADNLSTRPVRNDAAKDSASYGRDCRRSAIFITRALASVVEARGSRQLGQSSPPETIRV
jgi:hypothetical protein